MAGYSGITGRIRLEPLAGCYRNRWPDMPGTRSLREARVDFCNAVRIVGPRTGFQDDVACPPRDAHTAGKRMRLTALRKT